jgi:hypothetical protein
MPHSATLPAAAPFTIVKATSITAYMGGILGSKTDDHALELRTIAFSARGPSCVLLVYASEDGGSIHLDSLATGNGIEVGQMGMRRHTLTTLEAANLMRTIREELDRAGQLSQSKNARRRY